MARRGVKYFNEHSYDLCVLDVMMPDKDGFSLAEEIRSENEQAPIVFPYRQEPDRGPVSPVSKPGRRLPSPLQS
ncbi:MAG: response regulator [Flavobacteriales bacterium]|nr:response regulator [Flavobacteriales bacterium]